LASNYNSKSELRSWLKRLIITSTIQDSALRSKLMKLGEEQIQTGKWRGDICHTFTKEFGFINCTKHFSKTYFHF
jgi:hypothetical protein